MLKNLKPLLAILCGVIVLVAFGCGALLKPSTNIDAEKGPICERAEFADSLICRELHRVGFINAEDARDLILDANDISLILEVYTAEQLARKLDLWDLYVTHPEMTYSWFFGQISIDVSKATRVAAILKRRFAILAEYSDIIRASDRQLVHLLIQRIREASGISSP